MKLWDYLNKEYGLILLESEINDILEIARQEIELPSEKDRQIAMISYAESSPFGDISYDSVEEIWREGALWYENKVRNPYPKTM